jgi:integrase
MHDRYYAIYYRMGKKIKWEGIGWLTQGATLENAVMELANVMTALKSGAEVVTRNERRRRVIEEDERKNMQKITIADFWESKYHPHIKVALTLSAYKVVVSHFKTWLLPLFGTVPIVNIDNEHYEKLLDTLVKAERSQLTRNYVFIDLRRLLVYAIDNGYDVKKIPSARQAGFTASENNRRSRVITPQETRSILTELKQRDLNAYFITKFAFLSGCRFSEAANLKWQNVGDKALFFTKTKNGTSRRVLITKEIKELFDEIKLYSCGQEESFVFVNNVGNKHVEVPVCFKNVVEKLKLNEGRDRLDRLTFHSIRHTVASKLAPILDLRSLMDVMGWRQVKMAARYMHSDDSRIMKATETLGELFSGGDDEK